MKRKTDKNNCQVTTTGIDVTSVPFSNGSGTYCGWGTECVNRLPCGVCRLTNQVCPKNGWTDQPLITYQLF